jgi:hypothetical protein
MKTLSKTFVFVALALIAIIAIIAFRCPFFISSKEPDFPDQKFVLKIVTPAGEYVDVTSETDFKGALDAVRDKEGHYKIHFKRNDNTETDYNDFPRGIKTDKVTTSSATAKNGPAGESAANDPNVTYRVTCADLGAIKAVVKTLTSPTPTPP